MACPVFQTRNGSHCFFILCNILIILLCIFLPSYNALEVKSVVAPALLSTFASANEAYFMMTFNATTTFYGEPLPGEDGKYRFELGVHLNKQKYMTLRFKYLCLQIYSSTENITLSDHLTWDNNSSFTTSNEYQHNEFFSDILQQQRQTLYESIFGNNNNNNTENNNSFETLDWDPKYHSACSDTDPYEAGSALLYTPSPGETFWWSLTGILLALPVPPPPDDEFDEIYYNNTNINNTQFNDNHQIQLYQDDNNNNNNNNQMSILQQQKHILVDICLGTRQQVVDALNTTHVYTSTEPINAFLGMTNNEFNLEFPKIFGVSTPSHWRYITGGQKTKKATFFLLINGDQYFTIEQVWFSDQFLSIELYDPQPDVDYNNTITPCYINQLQYNATIRLYAAKKEGGHLIHPNLILDFIDPQNNNPTIIHWHASAIFCPQIEYTRRLKELELVQFMGAVNVLGRGVASYVDKNGEHYAGGIAYAARADVFRGDINYNNNNNNNNYNVLSTYVEKVNQKQAEEEQQQQPWQHNIIHNPSQHLDYSPLSLLRERRDYNCTDVLADPYPYLSARTKANYTYFLLSQPSSFWGSFGKLQQPEPLLSTYLPPIGVNSTTAYAVIIIDPRGLQGHYFDNSKLSCLVQNIVFGAMIITVREILLTPDANPRILKNAYHPVHEEYTFEFNTDLGMHWTNHTEGSRYQIVLQTHNATQSAGWGDHTPNNIIPNVAQPYSLFCTLNDPSLSNPETHKYRIRSPQRNIAKHIIPPSLSKTAPNPTWQSWGFNMMEVFGTKKATDPKNAQKFMNLYLSPIGNHSLAVVDRAALHETGGSADIQRQNELPQIGVCSITYYDKDYKKLDIPDAVATVELITPEERAVNLRAPRRLEPTIPSPDWTEGEDESKISRADWRVEQVWVFKRYDADGVQVPLLTQYVAGDWEDVMDRIYQYEFLCSDVHIFSLSPTQYVESTTVLHWWVDQPIQQLDDGDYDDESNNIINSNKNNNNNNNNNNTHNNKQELPPGYESAITDNHQLSNSYDGDDPYLQQASGHQVVMFNVLPALVPNPPSPPTPPDARTKWLKVIQFSILGIIAGALLFVVILVALHRRLEEKAANQMNNNNKQQNGKHNQPLYDEPYQPLI